MRWLRQRRVDSRWSPISAIAVLLLQAAGAGAVTVNGNSLTMKSNGASAGTDWVLSHTGYVGTYITLAAPGSVTIDVAAQGTGAAGVNPRMNVVINDESFGWDVPAGFDNYQHTFDLPAGTHFVRTEFANDAEKSARQLQIRTLDVSGATLANSNTSANALAASNTYIDNYRKGNVTVDLQGATPGTPVHVKLTNHAFNFGTAVAGGNFSTLLNLNPAPNTDAFKYQDKLRTLFNALVPENAGKWGENEFTRDSQWHPQLDKIVDFAEANGKRMRMHNLIWDNQQPNWVTTLLNSANSGSTTAKNDLRGEVSERIDYYVGDGDSDYDDGDFAAKYYELDVYNEFDHTPKYWNVYGAAGIADIYNEVAAAAGPNVGLATNEYNVLQDTGDFYGNWYKDKIEQIIAADGAVSAIGIQSYENDVTPSNGSWAAHDPVRKMQTLQNLAVLDMPIALTEFAVKDPASQPLASQLLEETVRLVFGNPEATGFFNWGFWRGDIWRGAAAFFDQNWNLTQPGQTWLDLMQEWDTDLNLVVGPDGSIEFDGFWGDYQIQIGDQTFDLALEKGTTAYSLLVADPHFGDFNNDGIVDAADYSVWRDFLGGGDDAVLNGNGDGVAGVGPGDYDVWKQYFGTNYGAGGGQFSAAIPEPALASLLTIGAALVGTCVRPRRHTW